jgi:hypothetical protein
MQITAEVEAEDILREAFNYLYANLPFDAFRSFASNIFVFGDHYLKDWMGLTISSIGDKELAPVVKFAIDIETDEEVKNDLYLVLDELEGK